MPSVKQQPRSARRAARVRRPDPEKRRRRPWRWIALVVIVGASVLALWPKPHGWQPLGPGIGRIRWVSTKTDALVEHPLAPGWIRRIRAAGIPWPTDLPTEPLGATFGGSGSMSTSAWYLVQSAHPSLELWHVDKESVRLFAPRGGALEWPGGTGSLLVDSHRRTQLLYLGVPAEHSGKGGVIRFRLKRFGDNAVSDEVSLPF